MKRPRIVIIGGGFAGLTLAKSLKRAKAKVTLVDKSNHHLFQPLLYQVATAALSPAEIAYPIREVFRRQPNTMVVMGTVTSIEKEEKKIVLEGGETLPYDYLVIATGTRHCYFGNNEWEKFAPGLKTIKDALVIRERILKSFEIAERIGNSKEAEKYLNFVVIGGGPTGVEMAGAIAEIAHSTMVKNFRKIRPEKSKVFLVEAMDHILPVYSEKLSKKAKKDLEKLKVKVLTGKKVTSITEEGVEVEGKLIPSTNVVWAAGNQASPLAKTLDTPLDRQGRIIVGPDLSIADHPEVFAIGDTAAFAKDPLPGVAPVAIQQGKYLGKVLKKRIPQEKRKPFKYLDKGSMATIGKGKAIAKVGRLEFGGLLAWLAWGFIHIAYLVGFRNRLGVMIEWIVVFLTGQRGVRLITKPIDSELP